MFRGLGQIRLPKVCIQLVDKLTPIIANGCFWECDQDRLPPKHGNVREVQSCIGHSLAVSHKLARSAIKGHDTANDEGVQLQWIPTSSLVGLSCFIILFNVTMLPCVVLLIGWPQAQWVTDRIRLGRGWIVVGHQAPWSRGVTKVLGWCDWGCDWGCWHCCWWCLEGRHEGHDWNGQHWEWCRGCWLGRWHWGRWCHNSFP